MPQSLDCSILNPILSYPGEQLALPSRNGYVWTLGIGTMLALPPCPPVCNTIVKRNFDPVHQRSISLIYRRTLTDIV